MAGTTEHLGLYTFDDEDFADFNKLNENAAKIDAAMKTAAAKLETIEEGATKTSISIARWS
jgi:hypothetical protein